MTMSDKEKLEKKIRQIILDVGEQDAINFPDYTDPYRVAIRAAKKIVLHLTAQG